MIRPEVYALIDAERVRQTEKWSREHPWGWGDCSSPRVSPPVKVAVLTEEVGEDALSRGERGDDVGHGERAFQREKDAVRRFLGRRVARHVARE